MVTGLRRELEERIRTLRAHNPFLSVSVVVPNQLLGVWLRRSIFTDTGHMAIDFMLAHELAWRVAGPGLLSAGRARLPENVGLALLLAAIPEAIAHADTLDYLRAAAETAGFAPAALRTIDNLSAAGLRPEALETAVPAAADPERLRLMARLWRGFEQGLGKAALLDRASLYRAAREALPSSQIGAVVVCGFDDPPPAAAAFLEALSKHHPFALVDEKLSPPAAPRHSARQQAFLTRLGGEHADQPEARPTSTLERIQARLFAQGSSGQASLTLDETIKVLSAAGESLEAVEIARLIQCAAGDGVRYQEIAVLLRSPDAYNVALASAFERAGIEAFFVEGTPKVDPAARGLSLLLELVGGDLDRARVMEFLTSARIRWTNVLGSEADISPTRWDRLSAEAGIVTGISSWRSRLAQAKVNREAREYEDDRDLRLYESLARLIERLASDLATIPERGSWGDFLDATLGLLDTWIEDSGLTRARLDELLRPLAQYAPAPSRADFLARVRELLANQRYREGQLGEGRVFVGSIAAARGLRFRHVFIPGLVERAFPGLVRPDPLLLDDERERLTADLRTTRDGQETERLLFLYAVQAAEERLVLSYPRFDTASGRERVPSSFLLRALEAGLGRRVGVIDLARLASPGATALGRPHPEDPGVALDRIERDLALVAGGQPGAARHLAEPDTFLVRSLAQERASWDRMLTAWDGVVDVASSPEALARLRLAGQRSSASVVEAFAACPYRHFLKQGLKLRAWEEPERAYQIEGKDFGSLYHEVAHRLFAELKEQNRLPLDQAAPDALAERIATLVDEALARFAAEGGIVNAALLDPVRVRLRSDLEEMLRNEVESADDGFVPEAFERDFTDVDVTLGEAGAISFRGKIDRLDVAQGPRRVRVIDYKTGKHFWKREEQFQGGRALQLALYNRAAHTLFPDHEVAGAVLLLRNGSGRVQEQVLSRDKGGGRNRRDRPDHARPPRHCGRLPAGRRHLQVLRLPVPLRPIPRASRGPQDK